LSALGGYAGLVPFTLFALALWLALQFLPARSSVTPEAPSLKIRILKVGIPIFIISAVCIAAWSPIFVSFFTEGAGYTHRANPLPPDYANFNCPFSLPALFSIFFPFATIVGRDWMQSDISMVNGYAGVLAVPLAASWLLKGPGKRQRWNFLAYFVFMFLVSLGGQAGIRSVLYYVLPSMRFVDKSGIFRAYWMLPLSLAAGLGYSALLKNMGNRRNALKLLVLWSAIATATFLGLALFLRSHHVGLGTVAPSLLFPAAVILAAGLPLLWAWARNGTGRFHKAIPGILIALFCADMAGHLYLNSATVWRRNDSIRRAEALHKKTTAVPGEPGGRLPPLYFGFFNVQQVVKVPVVQGFSSMKAGGFEDVLCQSPFVTVLQSPVRFWLSPGAEQAPPEGIALQTLARTGIGNAVPAFVEKLPDGSPSSRVIPGSYGKVRILSYEPEKIESVVDVPGPESGFLNSTERYAPGWKAWVDGEPREVFKTNLYFRGIVVPPGPHRVTWKYEPRFWKPLLFLSCASLVVSIAVGVLLLRRRKREPD
jgi:hypothetical protein